MVLGRAQFENSDTLHAGNIEPFFRKRVRCSPLLPSRRLLLHGKAQVVVCPVRFRDSFGQGTNLQLRNIALLTG